MAKEHINATFPPLALPDRDELADGHQHGVDDDAVSSATDEVGLQVGQEPGGDSERPRPAAVVPWWESEETDHELIRR